MRPIESLKMWVEESTLVTFACHKLCHLCHGWIAWDNWSMKCTTGQGYVRVNTEAATKVFARAEIDALPRSRQTATKEAVQRS